MRYQKRLKVEGTGLVRDQKRGQSTGREGSCKSPDADKPGAKLNHDGEEGRDDRHDRNADGEKIARHSHRNERRLKL